MPLAATQLDLEMIILSEINQTEKDKYMRSFVCRIFLKKMIQMNLFTKEKQAHRLRGCNWGCNIWLQLGKNWEGRNRLGDWD